MYSCHRPFSRWDVMQPSANFPPVPMEWGLSPELLQANRGDLFSVLPHDVAELVDEIVADIGATSELVLAMVLGTSAIGVQCVYDIQPPHTNMKPIPASLFVVGIAGSTQRKSAVLNLLTEAYVEYQQSEAVSEVHDTVQNARLRGWKADRQQIVEEIEAHYKDAQKVAELEERLKALEAVRPGSSKKGGNILNRDTSWPALAQGVESQSPSTSLVMTEARSILPSLGRWMPLINDMHDGTPIKRDRTSSEAVVQFAPRLSVVLVLQPKRWKEYVNDNGEDFLDSGTGGRALIVDCPDRKHSGEIRRHAIATRARDRQKERIKRLLSIFDEKLKFGDVNKQIVLHCSNEAREQWFATSSWIEVNLNQGGYFAHIKEFGGRCAENILRVASVLHGIAGCEGTEISIDIMRSAIFVMRFFAEQHLKMFGDLRTPVHERHAVYVEEYLMRYFVENFVSMIPIRAIQNGTLGGRELRSRKEHVVAALEVLAKRNIICIHYARNGPVSVSLNYDYFQRRLHQPTRLFYR